jgi:hypothetical protein
VTSHRYFAAAAVCLLAPFALAQTPAMMNQNITSTSGSVPQNVYAVDLNNDGVLDLVQDTVNQPNGFTVSIANGNGTFKAPVFYSVPDKSTETVTNPTPIATGDFNNDGNADVVVQVSGTNQLEVFLGKGDGTFQAPKTVSVSLPSGYYLTSAPIVASDFNQDGNVDLVVVASSSGTCCTNTVYVLEGNGEGSFSDPHGIYTDTGNHLVDGIVVGDFDGDGKPDIALTDDDSFQGSYFGTALVVLYGNGDLTFDKTTAYTLSNNSARLTIAPGDLNGDGKTDLFGVINSSTEQLAVFYAGSSRTFESYFIDLPGWVGDPTYPYFPLPLTPQLAMADFNGDGRMDIAGAQGNSSGPAQMVYLLAGANPGEFTVQTGPLQNLGSNQFYSNPIAADENHDGKPDIVINQASSDTATTSSITTQLNNTTGGTFPNCTAPGSGNGILLCSPAINGTSSSPLNFSASATSFGQLRKIELWVDGAKVNEQFNAWEHNAWFQWSGVFPSGSHYATLYAADVDNRLSRLNFDFTVSGPACSAPSSDGVHICAPANGSSASSPIQVAAAAKIAGTLNRMELWVDGEKEYSETYSLNFSTVLTLPAGNHRFDIYAVNNAGTKYESTVYATVN